KVRWGMPSFSESAAFLSSSFSPSTTREPAGNPLRISSASSAKLLIDRPRTSAITPEVIVASWLFRIRQLAVVCKTKRYGNRCAQNDDILLLYRAVQPFLLNIFQLVLIHPEIVAEFMDERQADLFADSGLARADRFNILPIKHDVIGSRRQVKYALLGRGYAMEETQKQPPLLPRLRRWLVGRHILYQNSNVTNAPAKFCRERVERLLDYLGEMFTLHRSPTKINRGTLTPSSRRRHHRHHRHLRCRRLRLPLRLLPRPDLVEREHRQLPANQKGVSRGILDVFCSCPNGTLGTAWQTQAFPMPRREERFGRERGADPDVRL